MIWQNGRRLKARLIPLFQASVSLTTVPPLKRWSSQPAAQPSLTRTKTISFGSQTSFCRSIHWSRTVWKKAKGSSSRSAGGRRVASKEEVAELIDVGQLEKEFGRLLDKFKQTVVGRLAQSSRVDLGLYEKLQVEVVESGADGKRLVRRLPLNHVGQLTLQSANQLHVHLTRPDVVKAAKAAFESLNANLNPQQNGASSLVVLLPRQTREHREELVQSSKQLFNHFRNEMSQVFQQYTKKAGEEIWLKGLAESTNRDVNAFVAERKTTFENSAKAFLKESQEEIMKEKL